MFQDPGAPTQTNLVLPQAPAGSTVPCTTTNPCSYLQVTGTGVSFTIGGQTLTGNFAFTSGAGVVNLNLSNVTLGLGDGTTNFVNVSNGNGTLSIVSSSSANNNQGGVYGQFGGNVAIDVPGVSFAGTLQVQFNTTGVTQGSLAAGTTQISGSGVHLTVAGVQMGADSFTITVTQGTASGSSTTETAVEIYVKNLTLSLGTFVNVTSANQLTGPIIIDSGGVAAMFSATNIGSIFTIPGVTIGPATGTMSAAFELNTGTQPVNETVTDPTNGNQTIDVAAGPFLKVVLNNAALQFGGSGGPSISGSFAFDQSTEAGFGSGVATAGGSGSGPTIPNVSAADVTSVAVADVNGDGFPDIVFGISGGADQLWLNAGKDSSGNWLGFTLAPSGANGLVPATNGVTAVSLTDVNNDGLPDLIVSTGGSLGTTSVYLNLGKPSTTLTAALLSGTSTVQVTSTAGFEPSGTLSIGGQTLAYSSLTATTFTLTTAATTTFANGAAVTPSAWQGFASTAAASWNTPYATHWRRATSEAPASTTSWSAPTARARPRATPRRMSCSPTTATRRASGKALRAPARQSDPWAPSRPRSRWATSTARAISASSSATRRAAISCTSETAPPPARSRSTRP